jgi:hypothetical protein
MRETLRAEKLLSLFTSAERAAAIAGDLTEECETHGRFAFWWDVSSTAAALWRRALIDSPVRILMLVIAGCALLVAPAFVGIAAVALFPASFGSLVHWIALSLIWSAGAACVGASLIGVSPKRGMAACMTLALVGEGLLIAAVRATPYPDLPNPRLVLAYTTALIAPSLLILGGAIARRRIIVRSSAALE